MKILVTGAGGFIGSHLAERCVELGYNVKAFVRYNSRNHWGWLEYSKFKNELDIIAADIRDYDSVLNALKNCSAVLHLAALIAIPYSYISPLAYIKTNIEGTYNVLQAAKVLEVENILITSTSETYGTAQYTPVDEKHPLVGQSPYSASKIAADQLAISYHRSFGLPVKIVRPFNTYGPRQSARAVIPTIINQILSRKKKIKLGSIHPTRDLTYVKDMVEGFLAVAESGKSIGEVINIGMNSEISIKNLVKLIAELMNVEIEIAIEKERLRPEKSEVERLRSDTKKAKELLGWSPKYTLESGLKETIAWFKRNMDFYKSEIYNV